MKKIFFLMLTFLIGIAASMNAQVRIGGTDDPNEAAVLDLNASDGSTDGTLGLALPRVTLTSLTAPLVAGKTPDNGTMVYNAAGTEPAGIYIWSNSKWNAVKGSASSYISDWGRPDITADECDGSVLYMGVFDYADGTPGDVAKNVTDASNTVDHVVLPTLSSAPALPAFIPNRGYYLCIYKSDGNKDGTSSNWANAVNGCTDGKLADGTSGWYLPNAIEMHVLLQATGEIHSFFNYTFYGVMVTFTERVSRSGYWTSTEQNATNAYRVGGDFSMQAAAKTDSNAFRCVKRL